MRPVTVSITVPEAREGVYDFLSVLENHAAFTDHFLRDWELAGPNSGVGAKARMRVQRAGPDDWLEMEVVASDRPRMTVEESVGAKGAKGRRRTRVGARAAPICSRSCPPARPRSHSSSPGRGRRRSSA
jgi:hypothetical protein